jgi:GTP cyclohydrolase FolE2
MGLIRREKAMLEVYSENVDVAANTAIPFQNVSIKKGCTAELSGASTIKLNKCGVYMVAVDATTSAVTTMQLYKDGIAQAQAQATGQALSFTTLVQVAENNSACPCASAVSLQIVNETAATYDNINVVVTKVV